MAARPSSYLQRSPLHPSYRALGSVYAWNGRPYAMQGPLRVPAGGGCARRQVGRSRRVCKAARSLRLARRMATAMNGANSRENPVGVPRFRRVIRVAPLPAASHVYVVSIGNGPSAVRITSRRLGTNSTTSYVYAMRRPAKCATNATLDPTRKGGGVFHSTDLIFT